MRTPKDKWPQRRMPRDGQAVPAVCAGAKPSTAVRLKIKAVPNSPETGIAGRLGDAWKVRIQAPPEDGKANKALEEYLAKKLSLPRSAVTVIAGAASREKMVAIEGLPIEGIEARLAG
ncbi:MAG: DUF167 domain-containing protein [Puniceicoccales bacterium]|nr:DUF167 domain-containing protein [Puniceicoccales bacterium]